MGYVYNNAEGAASGTTVSLANSDDNGAGIALDVSSSGTRQYSNTYKRSGATSFKCEGTSGNTAILGWDSTVGGSAVSASGAKTFRAYFWIVASPSATCEIVQVRNSGNGGAVQLRTDRKLNIVDDAATVKFTTTTVLSTLTMYRLEYRVKKGTGSGDGTIEFKLFLGDSTSPLDSYSTTTANQGTADFVGFRWGKLTNIASTETFYFDDVAQDDTETLLGPSVGPSDLQYTLTNVYELDATASVGAVTVTQVSGTTCVITEPSTGLFRIAVPEHPDPLWFELVADGDGDPVIETRCIKPDNNSTLRRLRAGGDPTVLTDWV